MSAAYMCGDFVTPIVTVAAQTTRNVLGVPFDIAREQYARSVQAGLIERSLLKSAEFGRNLCELERATLGPWARCN